MIAQKNATQSQEDQDKPEYKSGAAILQQNPVAGNEVLQNSTTQVSEQSAHGVENFAPSVEGGKAGKKVLSRNEEPVRVNEVLHNSTVSAAKEAQGIVLDNSTAGATVERFEDKRPLLEETPAPDSELLHNGTAPVSENGTEEPHRGSNVVHDDAPKMEEEFHEEPSNNSPSEEEDENEEEEEDDEPRGSKEEEFKGLTKLADEARNKKIGADEDEDEEESDTEKLSDKAPKWGTEVENDELREDNQKGEPDERNGEEKEALNDQMEDKYLTETVPSESPLHDSRPRPLALLTNSRVCPPCRKYPDVPLPHPLVPLRLKPIRSPTILDKTS